MRVASGVIAFLLATSVCLASDDNSIWEDYGKAFVGTWQADVTIDSDLPTGEKQGDVVEGEATSRWILKRKAIETDWRIGSIRGKTLEVWDPKEKCVRWFVTDSSGSFGSCTCSKTGDNTWVTQIQSVSAEGVCSSSTGKLTISNGGNTLNSVSTNRKEGDKTLADKTHAWKRFKK